MKNTTTRALDAQRRAAYRFAATRLGVDFAPTDRRALEVYLMRVANEVGIETLARTIRTNPAQAVGLIRQWFAADEQRVVRAMQGASRNGGLHES